MKLERFERQIMLPEFGEKGQAALASASVLIVGAGGLGAPAALYLAAAGTGRIGIADGDRVALSNLQRQVLYCESDIGRGKAGKAAERLSALSSACTIIPYNYMLEKGNIESIASDYDIIVDGCGGKGYEDLFPRRKKDGADTPLVTGVIGALPGIIGSIEAMEAIKVAAGIGETLRNRLLVVNALTMEFNTFSLD